MERINELSQEELIKLTDDQLQHFVDIEIAYAGIKLVNPVKLKELPIIEIKPSEVYYQVHDRLYRTHEEAQAVTSVPAFNTEYDYYGGGYDYKYATPREASIQKVFLYKKEDVDCLRSTLQKIREAKEYNQKMQGEYEKYLKAVDACRAEVYSVYLNAIEHEEAINRAITDHKKYLELAGGDEEIAMNFFNKAYKDEPENIKKIALERIQSQKVS